MLYHLSIWRQVNRVKTWTFGLWIETC